MKKIIVIFIAVLFASCESAITFIPTNSITFDNITSQEDLDLLLNEVAAITRNTRADQETMYPLIAGEYTDKISYKQEWIYTLERYKNSKLYYEDYYKAIAQANIILHYAPRVDMSKERLDYYIGSAYFYKALSYFDLIIRAGDCPLVKEDLIIESMPRSPWTQVCIYAIDMAQKAVSMLPEQDKLKDSKGKALLERHNASRGAANAVLADLAAWMAGCKYFAIQSEQNYDEKKYWDIAEKACSEIIKNTSNYSLVSLEELTTSLPTSSLSKESIFELLMHKQQDFLPSIIRRHRYGYQCGYEGYPVIPNYPYNNMNRRSFFVYRSTAEKWYLANAGYRDARIDYFFYDFDNIIPIGYEQGDNGEQTPIFKDPIQIGCNTFPNKFKDIILEVSGTNIGRYLAPDINIVRYRLADIYLLRAECRVQLGDNAGAIADLNTVRVRANAAPYTSTENNGDLKYTVFKEREKELIFEGKRFIDVLRNNYVKTELLGKYKTLTLTEMQEGALTIPLADICFTRNPKLRQTIYWQRLSN